MRRSISKDQAVLGRHTSIGQTKGRRGFDIVPICLQTRHNEGMAQIPIYYVSKALQDTETRYSEIEKLALALVIADKKHRPYFQAHVILVPTSHLLQQVLQNPDTSGRLTKWVIELGEFDVKFMLGRP